MSKKTTRKVGWTGRPSKVPSRRIIGSIITSIDTADQQLREGETVMARREESGKRPVTIAEANRNARLLMRDT